MSPDCRTTVAALLTALLTTTLGVTPVHADVESVLAQLNDSSSVVGSRDIKSYPVLFDAYLDLTPPPFEVGPDFYFANIHPGRSGWDLISGWAEGNQAMADAIIAAEEKTLFGLPYGGSEVEAKYREAGLFADVGAGGNLRNNTYPYLRAVDRMAAFATSEAYRRLEAGQIEDGLNLAIAMIYVARQCCDRQMIDELAFSIPLTSELLSNLRDMMYTYHDQISTDFYSEIGKYRLPFLSPDRSRLLMPEGDRIVSEALIRGVFDARDQPDGDLFAETFAEIQSRDQPLTRMGAARRWQWIAGVHDSLERSLDRLTLVYDDWWRRWRVQEYDRILLYETEFERTNIVRYAAVIYSLQDMQQLFGLRNELMASVWGTAVAAGMAGYDSRYGNYPTDSEKAYATFVRKSTDKDPFDREFQPFRFRVLDDRLRVDTPDGRVWIEPGMGVLYSLGADNIDDRAEKHTPDGSDGDLVLWPPMKALLREAGEID